MKNPDLIIKVKQNCDCGGCDIEIIYYDMSQKDIIALLIALGKKIERESEGCKIESAPPNIDK